MSIVGLFLEYVAWTVGLGAVLLTRFGTRGLSDGGDFYVPPVPPAGLPQAARLRTTPTTATYIGLRT